MKVVNRKKAYLYLEDGLSVEGSLIGYDGTTGGEICFNTGMTGYQEIYTDPSYTGQVIINTNAHIGNYGTVEQEEESESPKIKGVIINDYSEIYSRLDASESLDEYLKRHKVVGIAGLDTRRLVKHVRSKGAMNCVISSVLEENELKAELANLPSMEGLELSSEICTKTPYEFGDSDATITVAVLDLGIKRNILKNLESRGCKGIVYPAKTTFKEISQQNPDGYFISNGPGDPAVMDYAVETVEKILDSNKPLFGICLGHQMIARACGIGTYKMHHGHRGLNHPIKNLQTGLSEMTSQNHGFVVKKEDVEQSELVEATHMHLNDKTVAGIKVVGKNAFSVQYHPEASPGPHDSRYLFDDFVNMMKN